MNFSFKFPVLSISRVSIILLQQPVHLIAIIQWETEYDRE